VGYAPCHVAAENVEMKAKLAGAVGREDKVIQYELLSTSSKHFRPSFIALVYIL
jgi:hypothetical protein